jgi:adenylate cyclase
VVSVSQKFVARTTELARLNKALEKAIEGQIQICLLTGSAGTGKTALIHEFAARAQDRHEQLVVALGSCDSYTGAGEPYLPFREILRQLSGDLSEENTQRPVTPENKKRLRNILSVTGQVLVENGPDLIGTFIPGAKLVMDLGSTAFKTTKWFEKLENLTDTTRGGKPGEQDIVQAQIFEQYANVINKLAEKTPLIIALDDMHWADSDSIALFFRLTRRLSSSRVLLLGAYRSAEIRDNSEDERHPMAKAIIEIKRYFGDVVVDLDEVIEEDGLAFTRQYLDVEPNQLGEYFQQLLYQHTGGNPLFTSELLRTLQERGDLIKNKDGFWIITEDLDWEGVPARVEGALAERLHRIGKEAYHSLEIASVQGKKFAAEAVAKLQKLEARNLIRTLSGDLQDVDRLVDSLGVERIGQQRISSYQFAHTLIQNYLYSGLDSVEVSYLHEDMGNALEELYAEEIGSIANRLAHHFMIAQAADKARHYSILAGRQASEIFAIEKAIGHFTNALHFCKPGETELKFELLLDREKLYDHQGERKKQLDDLNELEDLAKLLATPLAQAKIYLHRAWYANQTGEFTQAEEWAVKTIHLLESGTSSDQSSDPHLLAQAYIARGESLDRKGNYELSQQQHEKALKLSQAINHTASEAHALDRLGGIAWSQGEHTQADQYYQRALSIARNQNDQRREWSILNRLGAVKDLVGDYAAAVVFYDQALEIVQSIGHRRGESIVLTNMAETLVEVGQYDQARETAQRALQLALDIGEKMNEEILLGNLADISNYQGDHQHALEYVDRALELAIQIGDRIGEGFLLGCKGNILLGKHELVEAEEFLLKAINVWDELGEPRGAIRSHAGLALVAIQKRSPSDLQKAEQHARIVADHLNENPNWEGGEITLGLESLLAVFQVYESLQNPEAAGILNTANSLLEKRAANITNQEARDDYLQNITAHRELQLAFAEVSKNIT